MITAGIDVGSLTAKAIIYDSGADRVVGRSLVSLTHDPAQAGQLALAQAVAEAGVEQGQLGATTATGYGRIALQFATYRITEISCHARGVHHLLPEVRTVVDVGGQDSKVTRLDEAGRALDFEMNDRCAAGTGRFLEVMAGALGVDLAGLSELALASTSPASLSIRNPLRNRDLIVSKGGWGQQDGLEIAPGRKVREKAIRVRRSS